MRTKLFLIFIFNISFSSLYASDEEVFAKAEKHYRAEEYDKAIELYLSTLEENEISATTFYNIGNCYYKKSDFIHALLYYEKSAKYDPGNEATKLNIEITQSKLSENKDELNTGISGWFYTIVNARAADYWTYLSLALSIIGTIFLFLIVFSTQLSLKRMALATSIVSFVFSIVFMIFSWNQISYFNSKETAMIISANSEAKSEPIEGSKTVFIIPGGMKIKILQEKEDWTEISLNANVGWIKTQELERL
jgi:tetratricopeptide (TPR) repeat protein